MARKSSAYRAALPKSAFEFELLAWLLLEDRSADDPGPSRRLSPHCNGPRSRDRRTRWRRWRRTSLTRRQASHMLATYAGSGTMAPSVLAALNARLTGVESDLDRIDADLSVLDLQISNLAPVTPLKISDVRALLLPDEALGTFVLPGLGMGRVKGLDASSNRVIVVTQEGVTIGRVGEHNRRLVRRDDRGTGCGHGNPFQPRRRLRLVPRPVRRGGRALAGVDHLIIVATA